MLVEINQLSRNNNGCCRRWFTDQQMDLILWLDDHDNIHGFQLCYDKQHNERVLTWRAGEGYQHNGIDNGESSPLTFKQTPILQPDGALDAPTLADEFSRRAAEIDPSVVDFVMHRIRLHPGDDN